MEDEIISYIGIFLNKELEIDYCTHDKYKIRSDILSF